METQSHLRYMGMYTYHIHWLWIIFMLWGSFFYSELCSDITIEELLASPTANFDYPDLFKKKKIALFPSR